VIPQSLPDFTSSLDFPTKMWIFHFILGWSSTAGSIQVQGIASVTGDSMNGKPKFQEPQLSAILYRTALDPQFQTSDM
jgi:hypothetical protein